MARRGSRRLDPDLAAFAAGRPSIHDVYFRNNVVLPVARRVVASLEDRRQFYPGPVRPPASVDRLSRRLVVASPKARNLTGRMDTWLSHRLAFLEPRNVAICAKRKIRREVLHAFQPDFLRRRGKGGGGRRRRNEFSDVRC